MKQLNEFELTYDQLNSHSIEILVYKVGTTKPSFKDFRLASVKFDLADLTNADQISTKKILEECDPSSTIQVNLIYFVSLRRKTFSFLLLRIPISAICSFHYPIYKVQLN